MLRGERLRGHSGRTHSRLAVRRRRRSPRASPDLSQPAHTWTSPCAGRSYLGQLLRRLVANFFRSRHLERFRTRWTISAGVSTRGIRPYHSSGNVGWRNSTSAVQTDRRPAPSPRPDPPCTNGRRLVVLVEPCDPSSSSTVRCSRRQNPALVQSLNLRCAVELSPRTIAVVQVVHGEAEDVNCAPRPDHDLELKVASWLPCWSSPPRSCSASSKPIVPPLYIGAIT
jgi:hypothetical protein